MGALHDVRARWAARRLLGSSGKVVGHRAHGMPVLEVRGREVLYRHHRGGETYFRLQLPCAACERGRVTWRGARIVSAQELEAANPGPQLCDACTETRIMADIEPDAVSAEFSFRDVIFDPEL